MKVLLSQTIFILVLGVSQAADFKHFWCVRGSTVYLFKEPTTHTSLSVYMLYCVDEFNTLLYFDHCSCKLLKAISDH